MRPKSRPEGPARFSGKLRGPRFRPGEERCHVVYLTMPGGGSHAPSVPMTRSRAEHLAALARKDGCDVRVEALTEGSP